MTRLRRGMCSLAALVLTRLLAGLGSIKFIMTEVIVSIDGGLDQDTLVIFATTTPATINLSLPDQSLGDTAIVTGFERR